MQKQDGACDLVRKGGSKKTKTFIKSPPAIPSLNVEISKNPLLAEANYKIKLYSKFYL